MMNILVPTINNNDEDALLVQWLVDDGASVEQGTVIAELETTKSTYDLEAEQEGYLKQTGRAGERYAFGAVIGHLSTAPGDPGYADAVEQAPQEVLSGVILTDSAKALIAEHQIPAAAILALGKKVVKADDLAELLSGEVQASPSRRALSPMQKVIGQVVSRSHQQIPSAFLLKKVYCDNVLRWITPYAQQQGIMLSLPDLMVYHTARLLEAEPELFATLEDKGHLLLAQQANVGVTFDLGKGLFIPVIRDAQQKTLVDIAKEMTSFRRKAMRASFATKDLEGANLSISLNMDVDTVCVRPIIPDGQAAMLSMGALLKECILLNGAPAERTYFNLGLVYDHRIVNGFEANRFVNRIKQRWEGPPEEMV